MTDIDNVTTDAAVAIYESANGIFGALLDEVRELSKKKPDATLGKSKIDIINAVLNDLLSILKAEPEGKYLQLLDDDSLPQVSDGLMIMVQFHAAMKAFRQRFHRYVRIGTGPSEHLWITEELLSDCESNGIKLKE